MAVVGNLEVLLALTYDKYSQGIGRVIKDTHRLEGAVNSSMGRIQKLMHLNSGGGGLFSRLQNAVGNGVSGVQNLLTGPKVAAGLGGKLIWDSLKAFEEGEKSAAKLEAVLKSTEHSAGRTATQIDLLAGSLQDLTTFEDDVTKNAAAKLLTFTNVKTDVFDDAIRAAQDMATVLDSDLDSAIMQLGKALNSPAEGLSALTRSGVSFTQQQKDVIKSLVETGRTAEAQRMILAELNKEFGGAAQAMAKTSAGKWARARNAFGNVMEGLGETGAPASGWLADIVTSTSNAATGTNPRFDTVLHEWQGDNGLRGDRSHTTATIEAALERAKKRRAELATLAAESRGFGFDENWGLGFDIADPTIAKAHEAAAAEERVLQDMLSKARVNAIRDRGGPLSQFATKGITGLSNLLTDAAKSAAGPWQTLLSTVDKTVTTFDDLTSHLDEAKAIVESTLSPMDKLQEQMRLISENRGRGLLTESQASRASIAAVMEAMQAQPDSRPSVAAFGSEAAFDAIARNAQKSPESQLLAKILDQLRTSADRSDTSASKLSDIERQISKFLTLVDPKRPRL
jgi:hypothetical protein